MELPKSMVITLLGIISGAIIMKYRIYMIEGEIKNLLVELNASTSEYWHRRVEKDKLYTYAICAVNDEDRERDPTHITVQ